MYFRFITKKERKEKERDKVLR